MEPIKICAQLYRVTTEKDGGSKIVLECGSESLTSVQKLLALNGSGNVNLAVAIVPFLDSSSTVDWPDVSLNT